MLTLKVVSLCLPKPRVISWYNCKVSADHLLPQLRHTVLIQVGHGIPQFGESYL